MKERMKEVNKEMDGSTMDGAEYRYKNAIDQPARQILGTESNRRLRNLSL